jgi:hypothetical protein
MFWQDCNPPDRMLAHVHTKLIVVVAILQNLLLLKMSLFLHVQIGAFGLVLSRFTGVDKCNFLINCGYNLFSWGNRETDINSFEWHFGALPTLPPSFMSKRHLLYIVPTACGTEEPPKCQSLDFQPSCFCEDPQLAKSLYCVSDDQ